MLAALTTAHTAEATVAERQLTWGGLATSWAAGRLIAKGDAFSVLLAGAAAETLRKVLGPNAQLSQETLSAVAGNLSLTTLPALMLYALGRGYMLQHESVDGGSIKMRFVKPRVNTEPPGEPV
jgi:hypothetical protein